VVTRLGGGNLCPVGKKEEREKDYDRTVDLVNFFLITFILLFYFLRLFRVV